MIWRRILLFLVSLGGGLGILAIVVGGDALFDFDRSETTGVAAPEEPPGGVIVRTQENRTGRSEGVPENVRFDPSGSGKIEPLQPPIELPSGQVLNVPEFSLAWRDAQPRGAGVHRLQNVTLVVYREVDPSRPAAVPVLEGRAGWMDVVAAQEGGRLAIDKEHAMDLYGVVLEMRGGSFDVAPERSSKRRGRLRLETNRLQAQILPARVALRSAATEPVTITSFPPPAGRSRLQIVVAGRGMHADIRTKRRLANEQPAARLQPLGPSTATLERDVRVRGVSVPDGNERFEVRGRGPLALTVTDAGATWTADLRNEVEFAGRINEAAGRDDPDVRATGDRLVCWFRRARRGPAQAGGPMLGSHGLTDLAFLGSAERASSLVFGGQRMRARDLELVLGARGEPASVTARGHPEIVLTDSGERALGTLRGRDVIRWRRPGRLAATALAGFGIDLVSMLQDFPVGHPVFPQELIHVTGPATYEPAGRRGFLQRGNASDGLVITATRRAGRIEPFLLLGLGDVELAGQVSGDARPRPFVVRGNRGFALSRDPGTVFVRATLGPATPDDTHEFSFRTDGEVLAGKGWVMLEASDRALVEVLGPMAKTARKGPPGGPSLLVARFMAALGEELDWKRDDEAGSTVRGVKSAVLRRHPGRPDALYLSGLPLDLADGEHGMRATAELVERRGDGPWLLQKGFEPVTVELAADADRPPVKLRADRVAVWTEPGFEPRVRARPEVWLHASGHVRVRTRLADQELDLELTAREFERAPWLMPPFARALTEAMLGGAGRALEPSLFGSAGGLLRARGEVVVVGSSTSVDLHKTAIRRLTGDLLLLDADGKAARLLLLPKAGEAVDGVLEQPGRGTVRFRGDRLLGAGSEFVLGGRTAAKPLVWLEDARFETRGRLPSSHLGVGRLRLRAGGAVTWNERELRVPGPVRAVSVDASDQRIVDGFFLSCRDDVEVAFVRGSGTATQGRWKLPTTVGRIRAAGRVETGYGPLRARGSTLSFEPGTGWLELASTSKEPVVVRFGTHHRVATHPWIRVNLLTSEVHASSGTSSGVLRGPR